MPKKDNQKPELLNLVSTGAKEIGVAKTNEFAQKFIAGVGEVVIRFKNFTTAKKYFTFSVTETDAEGKPLEEPAQ